MLRREAGSPRDAGRRLTCDTNEGPESSISGSRRRVRDRATRPGCARAVVDRPRQLLHGDEDAGRAVDHRLGAMCSSVGPARARMESDRNDRAVRLHRGRHRGGNHRIARTPRHRTVADLDVSDRLRPPQERESRARHRRSARRWSRGPPRGIRLSSAAGCVSRSIDGAGSKVGLAGDARSHRTAVTNAACRGLVVSRSPARSHPLRGWGTSCRTTRACRR